MPTSLFSWRDTKPISCMEILLLRNRRLCHSPNQALCAVWRMDGAGSIVSLKLVVSFPLDWHPWEQPASRPTWIWLKESGRRAAMRLLASSEKMNTLLSCQNLCTGALVFLWDVMGPPYDSVWYTPFFSAVCILMPCFLFRVASGVYTSSLFSSKINYAN